MRALLNLLDRFVALPAMICVRLHEIVARKVFGVPSNIPQCLEWELFLLLVFLTLGYGHVRGAHVRVDIIRDRLRPPMPDRIELVGLLYQGAMIKGAMPFGLGLLLPAALVAALRNLSRRRGKD
ncbi:MAG: TRAP transporter small permease subunit [Alphaproteobacteria bacterium]